MIAFRDGAAGRRPGLVGSRLDVWQVVETVKQNGDEWTARANELAEREQASWRRQQELVG